MRILIFAVLVAAWVPRASSCDLCAMYAASQARGEVGRGPFVGVAQQFTHFGTVQVEGKEVPDPSGQQMDSSISQLFAGYNFNNRFGIQFNVPVIYRWFKRPDSEGGIQTGTESGIGDAALLGTFVPYRKASKTFALNWTVLAGVKFPTGSSDRIKEEFNEVEAPMGPPSGIHGHDLTLGSGAFDGIVGTGFYARQHRTYASVNVQYAIRSEGDFNYRFANDLTWSAGPGYYVLLKDEYSLAIQAIFSGEHKGKDKFGGETAEDTAVTSYFLGPEIDFTWGEHLSAYLAADLPMRIQNSSLQTVIDYRIRAGLTWHF